MSWRLRCRRRCGRTEIVDEEVREEVLQAAAV